MLLTLEIARRNCSLCSCEICERRRKIVDDLLSFKDYEILALSASIQRNNQRDWYRNSMSLTSCTWLCRPQEKARANLLFAEARQRNCMCLWFKIRAEQIILRCYSSSVLQLAMERLQTTSNGRLSRRRDDAEGSSTGRACCFFVWHLRERSNDHLTSKSAFSSDVST